MSDWTFEYFLSQKIEYDNLQEDSDITFVTEGSFLTGFKIIVRGLSEVEAEYESKSKARNLRELIIIRSGMAVKEWQLSVTESGNIPRNVVGKSLVSRYKILGKIDELDLNKVVIGAENITILKTGTPVSSRDLKFLSDAVLLRYFGFNEYSIRESYKILEKNSPVIDKWVALRNALTHEPLKSYWLSIFKNEFDSNYFDYIDYNSAVINFDSNKTQEKLDELAKRLITECKQFLRL